MEGGNSAKKFLCTFEDWYRHKIRIYLADGKQYMEGDDEEGYNVYNVIQN